MRRALIIVGVILVAAVIVFFWRSSAVQKAKDERAARILAAESETTIPVNTAPVVAGDIERVLRYTGLVEPADRVEVTSKMSGRIVSVRVREGDDVAKDEVLAVIDPEITGQKFEAHEVTAPVAGRVSQVFLDPGAFVSQMVPIVELINDTSVKVVVGVLEKDYHLVGKGTPVRIEFDALPGRTLSATVTKIMPTVDRATGTVAAEVAIDNRDRLLKAGMFARVAVVAETHKNAMLLPREATVSEVLAGFGEPVETVVFVVDGDRARERTVTLGLADDKHYEVLDGLRPGDVVVTLGQNLLRDGSRVTAVSTGS
jgi:multidrug efflux pump subunit AcrA (membrane-fusion protein)